MKDYCKNFETALSVIRRCVEELEKTIANPYAKICECEMLI